MQNLASIGTAAWGAQDCPAGLSTPCSCPRLSARLPRACGPAPPRPLLAALPRLTPPPLRPCHCSTTALAAEALPRKLLAVRQTTATQVSTIRQLADQGVDLVSIANQVSISTISTLQLALNASFATVGGCAGTTPTTGQMALALQKTMLSSFSDLLYYTRSARAQLTDPAIKAALANMYGAAEIEEIFQILQGFVVNSLVNLEVQLTAATTVNPTGTTESRIALLLNLNQRLDLQQVLSVIKLIRAVGAKRK